MAVLPGSLLVVDGLSCLEGARRVRTPVLLDLAKVPIDFCLSLILLALALPIMLFCALVIRLSSPGAVILRQRRLGKKGRPFTMYKLRTMIPDAEAATGPVLASEGDSRVIPACRWMRRSHVDELPQLVNILCGQMSLIGPRPERPEIAEQIYRRLPEFRHRLAVRPGVTGLAQVLNGYDTCLDAAKHKLNYDMQYIHRRSWWLDLWILGKTVTKLYDSSSR